MTLEGRRARLRRLLLVISEYIARSLRLYTILDWIIGKLTKKEAQPIGLPTLLLGLALLTANDEGLHGIETLNALQLARTETYEVTAYTANYESTGKTPSHPLYGVTASGAYVEEGVTIAAPPSIPFGTRIYIPYFDEVYTVQDRGGDITEGHLDIYYEDLDGALEFGRRDLPVIILPPMSGKGTIE
jgi:3D (Asp-Asp-Asp) domain-containing protein